MKVVAISMERIFVIGFSPGREWVNGTGRTVVPEDGLPNKLCSLLKILGAFQQMQRRFPVPRLRLARFFIPD
jgi:hypothetical protein